ncbi:MAG: MoaD/ThiS family protein [Candidatus Hydrogenedentes bacterium]|nr:MoaD/ThiS family protein [Candidatus Hydrogenedentota bacterium]
MNITVHLLGQLGHIAGRDSVAVEAEDAASVREVVLHVTAAHGASFREIVFTPDGAFRPSLMVLCNEVPIDKDAPPKLRDGDQVTLLTAIAGG